jgi:hypothetical protein
VTRDLLIAVLIAGGAFLALVAALQVWLRAAEARELVKERERWRWARMTPAEQHAWRSEPDPELEDF